MESPRDIGWHKIKDQKGQQEERNSRKLSSWLVSMTMTTGDDISSGAKGKKRKHVRSSCYGSFSSNHEEYIFQINKMELYKKGQKRKKDITITNWYDASKETQVKKRHSQIISTIFPFCFSLFFLILWIRSKVDVGFWRDAKSNGRPTAKKKQQTFSHYLECVCVFTESSIQQARAIRRIPPTLHIYKKNCLKMTARSTHVTLFSFLFLTATSSFFQEQKLSISSLRYRLYGADVRFSNLHLINFNGKQSIPSKIPLEFPRKPENKPLTS